MPNTQTAHDATYGATYGAANARRSWIAFALTPVVLSVGFVLGTVLLGDPNDPASPHDWDAAWRVLLLWGVVEVLPVLGMVWGRRAFRAGSADGRAPLLANLVVFLIFVGITLVGGLVDGFSG